MSNTYLPCNDINQPVCRQHVNQGYCRRGNKCRFYHPKIINTTIKKKAERKLGYCYCGHPLKKLVNSRYVVNDNKPLFFMVCSRSGRSISNCM